MKRSVLAACCKRIKRLQLPLTASNRYFGTLALPLPASVCAREGVREGERERERLQCVNQPQHRHHTISKFSRKTR